MKSIAIFVLLIGGITLTAQSSQIPEVELQLSTRNGTVSKTLLFGLDPIATDGRDTTLGESELPPPPPAGVFDMRFTLQHLGLPPGFQGLDKDYRQGSMSTIGTRHHRLKFQRAAGQDTIVFSWNLPNGVAGTLKDLFGGILINKTMAGVDSLRLGISALSELDMFVEYDGSLPIQLASFTASIIEDGRVRLDWTTLSETNNYGFEIEKTLDPQSGYTLILNSFIPGQGTTTVPHDYSYIDESTTPGDWYYRLKQIDLDGTVHYSEAVQVEVLASMGQDWASRREFRLAQNYPNPFNPSTNIRYSIPSAGMVKLKVFDALGREVATLVNETKVAGTHSVTWDASEVAGGVYFYRLESAAGSQTRRLLLLK